MTSSESQTAESTEQDGALPDEVQLIRPGTFEPERHFYPRVLNAAIHPLVSFFLRLNTERIIARYCHLNPQVDHDALESVLTYRPRFLRWSGADLFHVTTAEGLKKMVLIETNSSPSGQKSMPLFAEHLEHGGYRSLLEQTVKPLIDAHKFRQGGLAVLYDKNYMEASGYAAAMAELYQEDVYLTPCYDGSSDLHAQFRDKILHVRPPGGGSFVPVRAALRYVTQKPWNRIPISSRTLVVNPVLACLAGGRNKMVADMAYDMYNGEMSGSGLYVRTPETVRDLHKREVPLIVRQFGGQAVIKIPYSNAGQGVFTITSEKELERFLEGDYHYDKFIVQSLIGNYQWSSHGRLGKLYHVGTVPNRNTEIYVADLRMMVGAGHSEFRPIAIYGRRARLPLVDVLSPDVESWDILGTNLSVKRGKNNWDTETSRLLLMDRKDFNLLGVGLDDLIRAFVQTVLATVAIDKMAGMLITKKGAFRKKLFSSINSDEALLREILE